MKINEILEKRPPKNDRFYAVAIDGRGAAGKTSLINHLRAVMPDFTFLNFDDYFEPRENSEEWGYLNKLRFNQDVIKPLKVGNNFKYRPYDWHRIPHITERIVNIEKGLCLEGCFSFSFDLDWDLKIWVETPKDLCLERGVTRDTKDWTNKHALHVWRDIWIPQEDKYIERIKPLETADIILNGQKPFENQIK